MKLVAVVILVLASASLASPPDGWPVAIKCTRNFVKIASPSYSVVEPFTLWWSDEAFAYQGYYSFCVLQSDGVGGFYLTTDLGDDFALSDLPFAGWPLANNDVVVVQSLDFGVGSDFGRTLVMWVAGLACGLLVGGPLLWLLSGFSTVARSLTRSF